MFYIFNFYYNGAVELFTGDKVKRSSGVRPVGVRERVEWKFLEQLRCYS